MLQLCTLRAMRATSHTLLLWGVALYGHCPSKTSPILHLILAETMNCHGCPKLQKCIAD